MTEETRVKLSKIYELVIRGEGGEKQAAKLALDRLIKKHNISEMDIKSILLKKYCFKYSNDLEIWLFQAILSFFFPCKSFELSKRTTGARQIEGSFEFLDYVVVSTAYEYFRKHMMVQYKDIVHPQVKRCRTPKTKNKRRKELQYLFFSKYIIASNLYKEKDLKMVDTSKMTDKEYQDRMKLEGVKGGQYNTQVTTGLYLE